MKTEADTRITITVPAELRRELKVRAARNDRSFSGEIVHCLKAGVGWFDAASTDGGNSSDGAESLATQSPVAGSNTAALASGASITSNNRTVQDA